jgi:hypothetical protein
MKYQIPNFVIECQFKSLGKITFLGNQRRPLERLDSIDTDSNRPQNDVLSLDGAHIGEPISSAFSLDSRQWRELIGSPKSYSYCLFSEIF